MNKRLRKKKLKQKGIKYIELPLDKLQDIELLDSGKLDREEWRNILKERLGKCFYYDSNTEEDGITYGDILEMIKEKLENENYESIMTL